MKRLPGTGGQVTVEFLFVFPAFLILCLLVIEIALMWSEKHIIRLAAYESARAVLQTANPSGVHAEGNYALAAGYTRDSLCWQPNNQNHLDRQVRRAAFWAATKKVALVAPSPMTIMNGIFSAAHINANLITIRSLFSGTGRLSTAIVKWMEGLPVAYALTGLECQYQKPGAPTENLAVKDQTRAVSMTLTYWRAPKMPFAGQILWIVFLLQKSNEYLTANGLGGLFSFDIDPILYSGFRANMPVLATIEQDYEQSKSDVKSIIENFRRTNGSIADFHNQVAKTNLVDSQMITDLTTNLPFGNQVGTHLTHLTQGLNQTVKNAATNIGGGSIAEFTDSVNQGLNEFETSFDSVTAVTDQALLETKGRVRKGLDQVAKSATAIAYAVPQELRLIPMRVTVRLVPPGENVDNGVEPWHGRVAMIGPLRATPESNTSSRQIWSAWAKQMAERSLEGAGANLLPPGGPE